jgi:hypothetical protein
MSHMMMLPSAQSMGANSCLTAVAPIVVQGMASFDAVGTNTGATPVDLYLASTGDNVPFSGTVYTGGCN